jgi:membrane-associated phospholipid phosphatase
MQFLYLLEGIRCPFLDTVFSLITELGGETLYMALAIAVYWCVSKGLGFYILTTGFVGTIANQFLKLCFRIPRPWVLDPDFEIVESARAAATGYSFPSGHTQNAFSSFGCLGMWTKKGWRVLCFAIVVLIGFSRMYLGVHTPLDVGVAFALGLVLMLALYPLFRDIEEHPKRMYAVIAGMLALTIAYLCYAELWPFPADIDADNLASGRENGYKLLGAASAMLLSYWLDRRYIRFETKAQPLTQALKLVLGLALVVGLRVVLKAPMYAVFGEGGVADAARYFLVVLFAAAVWPMSFRFLARIKVKKS